jgi:hypothetical protein
VSAEADGSYEDEQGGADGSQKVYVHVVSSEMSAAQQLAKFRTGG